MVWLWFTYFIIIFLVIIELTTIVHEFGHFVIAKHNKVRVLEFSIGFGPKIVSWKRNNTLFSIKWLPFGGYVSTLTYESIEIIDDIKKNINNISSVELDRILKEMNPLYFNEDLINQIKYEETSYLRKIKFLLMGVTFNLISIFIVLFLFYIFIGQSQQTGRAAAFNQTLIYKNPQTQAESSFSGYVSYQSIEYTNNSGNEITATNYNQMKQVAENPSIVMSNQSTNTQIITVTYYYYFSSPISSPNTSIQTVNGLVYPTITYTYNNSTNKWTFSEQTKTPNYLSPPTKNNPNPGNMPEYITTSTIRPVVNYVPLTTWNSFKTAFVNTWVWFIKGFVYIILLLRIHYGLNNYSTPFNPYMTAGLMTVITFADLWVILSALLIAFNLLPIPPLDGYKFWEETYKKISHKDVPEEFTKWSTRLGIGVIIVMTVFMMI